MEFALLTAHTAVDQFVHCGTDADGLGERPSFV